MRRRSGMLSIASGLIATLACAPAAHAAGAQASSTPAQPPSLAVAEAATYVLGPGDGAAGAPTYTLRDGAYTDAEQHESLTLIRDVTLQGDLDGDGVDDLVVLLVHNSGGSGVFSYLAPLLSTAVDAPVSATFVGDRVGLRGWALEEARLRLDVLEAGPEDASCCPGDLVTRRWYVQNGHLVEDFAEIGGRLGVASIAGAWRLVAWDIDEPLAATGVEVTLQIADGTFSGHAGCNRYSGSLADGDAPGDITVAPIIATRMACPGEQMDIEDRFLRALGAASRVGFHLGKLAVGFNTDAGHGTLLLEAAEPRVR